MPQPLRSRRITSFVTGDVTLLKPELALGALNIIMAAAEADMAVSKVLVTLSPANGPRLAEHYNSQEGDAKKGATLEAIAAVLLPPDRQELLSRILRKHRSASKERTPFAHWRYAHSPQALDLLILVDPKKELIAEANSSFVQHNWADGSTSVVDPDEGPDMLDRLTQAISAHIASAQSYDIYELDCIARRFRLIRTCFDLFRELILMKDPQAAQDALSHKLEQCLVALG